MKFAEWAKAYAALVGLLASAGLGVSGIPTSWKLPLVLVVAAAGVFAVWKVPNADPPVPPVNWPSQGPAWDEPYVDDYFDAA